MKINTKTSTIGGLLAFLLATSCCWLPALIIAIGGGSTLIAISNGLEKFSGLFMGFGIVLIGLGVFQYRKKNQNAQNIKAILQSVITCPDCGHKKEETMPSAACQFFYECKNCTNIIKPMKGDCCVYCSYGTVPCPPIQLDKNCC